MNLSLILLLLLPIVYSAERYAFCGSNKCKLSNSSSCTDRDDGPLAEDMHKEQLKSCPSGYVHSSYCKFEEPSYSPLADQYIRKCKKDTTSVNITQNGGGSVNVNGQNIDGDLNITQSNTGNSSKPSNGSNNGNSSKSSTGNKLTSCSPNPCKNNSTCSSSYFNGRGSTFCTCVGGFTGTTCEIPPNPCVNNYCNTNGSCKVLDGKPRCTCNYGFEGTTCSVKTKRTNKTAAATPSSATNFFTFTWLLLFALTH